MINSAVPMSRFASTAVSEPANRDNSQATLAVSLTSEQNKLIKCQEKQKNRTVLLLKSVFYQTETSLMTLAHSKPHYNLR